MTFADAARKALRPSLWGAILLCGLILAGSFYNLGNYPTVWWDEAIFSETAANIVQYGRYAFTLQSPGELNDFDFRISAGPAVILPVALAYKIWGVGVVPGRLVAGAYLALAFLALFLVSRRLWGSRAAWLAVVFALLGTDVLHWGRSVLGDIPALCLFLWAAWFLVKGLESFAIWPLALAGMFLGLAFDAKEFYGLAFLPPLALLARLSWRDRPRLFKAVAAYGAGLTLPLLAYLLLKAVVLGSLPDAVHHFLRQKQLLCHEFFTPLTIGRIYPESLLFLLKHPLFWLGIIGAVWTWKREPCSPGRQFWIWNFFLWSLVYLTAVYWHRFALPALFLAGPLAANFLLQGLTRLAAAAPPGLARRLSPAVLVVVLLSFYPTWGLDYLGQALSCRSHSPSRLVDYLRAHVPNWCLIETPEYELAFLDDDHRIHLMPEYFFVEATPDRIVLLNPRLKPYDFNRIGADLLILGTFGKGVFRQIYPASLIERSWRRIVQVDNYDIYVSRQSEKKMLRFLGKNIASSRPDGR